MWEGNKSQAVSMESIIWDGANISGSLGVLLRPAMRQLEETWA